MATPPETLERPVEPAVVEPAVGRPDPRPSLGSASPWPRRLAVLTLLLALPLVLFGGSVTTSGEGMAVQGWIDAEGHFLPLFPVDKWLRNFGTFVEHSHRMFGIAVGLSLIACVVATFARDRRRSARAVALVALLAVVFQGALGGTRVLEASRGLAFVHGSVAQAVFAILWGAAAWLAPAFAEGARGPRPDAPDARAAIGRRLLGAGGWATAIVYGQVVLGAVFRHSYRVPLGEAVEPGFPIAAFLFHAMGAIVVLFAVMVLAKRLRQGWQEATDDVLRRKLRRLEVFLHSAFGLQFVLGLGALATLKLPRDAAGPLITSTLHVLFGALTLALALEATLWGLRLARGLGAGQEARP